MEIIGEEGNVIFENLPVGLYLLVQTEAAEEYNAVSSFLVSVPLQDGDGWIYNVDGNIKTSADRTAELPVPVMAMSGMLLFMIGWSMYRGKNADEA
ncbi:MAG: hypothetical protein ACI4S0_00615 [Dorea sp.]